MIDFTKIDYLKSGNERQKRAYQVLSKHHLFEKLKNYSPVLAGTIPIEIDIEGSDLDLICEVDLKCKEDFLNDILNCIPHDAEIEVAYPVMDDEKSITVNFVLEEFAVEIFGQNKPAKDQNAYRHMLAEYRILQKKGDDFKQQIIELKKQGIKTEPAFGMLLKLENSYEELLKL